MLKQEFPWSLMCKTICGEASETMIKDLEELLATNADMKYAYDIILELFQTEENSGTKEIDAAFQNLCQRMKQQNIQFTVNKLGST